MGREDRALADAVERVAERFGALLGARLRLERDRSLAPVLSVEVRPVAEALLEGIANAPPIDASANERDARAFGRHRRAWEESAELREAFTLASLLGRRAAVLGATPTGVVAIAPCLVEAARPEAAGAALLLDGLAGVALEGYCAAREELLGEEAARRMADAIASVELAPGCLVVLPGGAHDPDELERVFDALGRRMLSRDARACVVHLGALGEPDVELARRVFGLRATCAMLGVRCFFTETPAGWRAAAVQAGIDIGELEVEPDFASGVRAALEVCGLSLRPRAALGGVLRRLVTLGRDR